MTKEITNYGKSVRTRLLDIAKQSNYDYMQILLRYLHERLLYRLMQTPYADNFYLKGGALLYAYEQYAARPTRDIDFLGQHISRSVEIIKKVFEEIADVKCPEDGVTFDAKSIQTEEISLDKEYNGVKVTIVAYLDTINKPISIDIGFGDVITPQAEIIDYPILLDDKPSCPIKAYSMETVIAEKFEAMITLSEANSRMKDFYDVYHLLTTREFDIEILTEAVIATCHNRQTQWVVDHPLFTESFATNPLRNSQWKAYLKRIKVTDEIPFSYVMETISKYLQPIISKI